MQLDALPNDEQYVQLVSTSDGTMSGTPQNNTHMAMTQILNHFALNGSRKLQVRGLQFHMQQTNSAMFFGEANVCTCMESLKVLVVALSVKNCMATNEQH